MFRKQTAFGTEWQGEKEEEEAE
jgi:hypothetical protein